MPVQSQLFPEPQPPGVHPAQLPNPVQSQDHGQAGMPPPLKTAPLWLQRLSLFVLVLFCVYLGVLVAVLPWWTRVWDDNLFILARPKLAAFLHLGPVKGIISGLGLIDVWIGISEAVHYREPRA